MKIYFRIKSLRCSHSLKYACTHKHAVRQERVKSLDLRGRVRKSSVDDVETAMDLKQSLMATLSPQSVAEGQLYQMPPQETTTGGSRNLLCDESGRSEERDEMAMLGAEREFNYERCVHVFALNE